MENTHTIEPISEQERQSRTSLLLIFAIVFALFIFGNCTYASENEFIFQVVLVCPILLILCGIYTFTYRGRAFLFSRIVFFILLLLSILSIWAFLYVMALGKAFQH